MVINSPVSTTCSQFVADVGKQLNLPADAFELVYEQPVSSSDEQQQVVFYWHIFVKFAITRQLYSNKMFVVITEWLHDNFNIYCWAARFFWCQLQDMSKGSLASKLCSH